VHASAFDPSILQDFLTESGELLEQLDQDLVTLEDAPQDTDLINQVFRALHTIKGSASFLALTPLVEIAHAAESALNAARNGNVLIDQRAMDLLLRAVDVIRGQFEDLGRGAALRVAEAGLATSLTDLAAGKLEAAQKSAAMKGGEADPLPQNPNTNRDGSQSGAAESSAIEAPRPLDLDSSKLELIDFLIADIDHTIASMDAIAGRLSDDAQRDAALDELAELAETVEKSGEFFHFDDMRRLASALSRVGRAGGDAPAESVDDIVTGVRSVLTALEQQCRGLEQRLAVPVPVEDLIAGINKALRCPSTTEMDDPSHSDDGRDKRSGSDAATVASTGGEGDNAAGTAANLSKTSGVPSGEANADNTTASPVVGGASSAAPVAEQTIRVEVGRLESLLNLVGELVLQKNRVSALSRDVLATCNLTQETRDALEQSSGGLDRVTSDIQLAVMRTRMQPLDKLFQRYPRLIRDLARKLNKKIRLDIVGGETEVDKSVIEELGDPLVHLIRNSCDHGIETAEERAAAGKDPVGVVKLCAAHEGSHVRVQIIDDGRGLSREKLAKKAIERGLVTESELTHMSDRDVFAFIFAAGFSTADQVSDVSGRGVGMDVVRTNIEKLKGTIELDSQLGRGTTLSIKIPLTLSIMSAMMVRIADELYAIPLGNILEIVRPENDQLSTIRGHPVMRLRDSVLPLLDAQRVFGVPADRRSEAPFVVVLSDNGKHCGLLVTGPVGQQEIVIKPLDGTVDRGGPLSGATVRADGGVSLIVDVARLVRMAETPRNHEPQAEVAQRVAAARA